ncbi:MAG: hypothetical protein M9894_22315 [Planctomycetes bacterium]|nr:hypothetical protein [Planctomycetota bacterium]
MERCPLCHGPLSAPASAVTRCEACGTPAHAGCLRELGEGRCPVLGCARAARAPQAAKPGRRPWRALVLAGLAMLLGVVGWVIAVERANRRPSHSYYHPPGGWEEPVPPDPASIGSDADLTHVQVGQRYRYVLTNPGAPPLEMEYRVTDVGRNRVAYEITTLMDMGGGLEPVGSPMRQEWVHHPLAPSEPPPHASPPRTEPVRVGDLELECWIIEAGRSASWVPTTGGMAVFPGVVRTVTDGRTTLELTDITGP